MNLDDLRRLREEAMAAGTGTGRWIKCAQALMDAFPTYYETARAMNERLTAAGAAICQMKPVVVAAQEWSCERPVSDWADAALLKVLATFEGDRTEPCEGCDGECGEPCQPCTVAEMHAGIDRQTAALVEAVIHQESRGNPKAVSNKGATGLMQIMPDTAKDIAKALGVTNYDLKDPKTNRLFGEFYLRQMLDQFGNAQLALAAYNAGPGRVSGWIKKYGNDWGIISRKLAENGTFQETRDYVPAILNSLGEVNAKKLRIDV